MPGCLVEGTTTVIGKKRSNWMMEAMPQELDWSSLVLVKDRGDEWQYE